MHKGYIIIQELQLRRLFKLEQIKNTNATQIKFIALSQGPCAKGGQRTHEI